MDIENLILRARTMIGYGLSPAEIRDALALDDEGMANLIIMAAKIASKEIEA